MPFFLSLPLPDETPHARILAQITRRRQPERQLLGALALAVQHNDDALMDAAVAEALAWPEVTDPQCARKAALLYAMTALLARAHATERALWLAPLIPHVPGMTQVMVFSTDVPPQRFCWRVTPAYALVKGRSPDRLPVGSLVQPYRSGHVHIDHEYLQQVLLPRRRLPRPILLLPHPLGLVQLGTTQYVILDGNHRVVCAWRHNFDSIPAFVLTPQEAAAVMLSRSQWPPYLAEEGSGRREAGKARSQEGGSREEGE